MMIGMEGDGPLNTSGMSSVSRQREHAQRLTKEQEARVRSRQELGILASNREMEPCTFQPSISPCSRSSSLKMTASKARAFFERGELFKAKKMQKLEYEREKKRALAAIDPAVGKPKISRGSARIMKAKKPPKPVHERLF